MNSLLLHCSSFCGKTFKRELQLDKHNYKHHAKNNVELVSSTENSDPQNEAEAFELNSKSLNNEIKMEPSNLNDTNNDKFKKTFNDDGKLKKTSGKYMNLYTHEVGSSSWHCTSCSASFASDRGIYRHLTKTRCGFGAQEDYKPRNNWQSRYTKQDNKWICCGSGAVYHSDHGITRHLRNTRCGEAEVKNLLYRQTTDMFTCNGCEKEYQNVHEVEKHVKTKCDSGKKVVGIKQRRDYSGLYTQQGKTFICAGCQVEYRSDRGVQRHLVNTKCGFGDKFRSAPKNSYADMYIREGSHWVCLSCGNFWGSDRGIHRHLKETRCGFGEKKYGGTNDYNEEGQIMEKVSINATTPREINMHEVMEEGCMDVTLEEAYAEVPLQEGFKDLTLREGYTDVPLE